MSNPDDTQPNRGRPVLKRIDAAIDHEDDYRRLQDLASAGKLWMFCGEYDVSTAERAADAAASMQHGGIFKVFPSGSWPGGYLRD